MHASAGVDRGLDHFTLLVNDVTAPGVFSFESIRSSTLHRVAPDRASAPASTTRLITLLAVPVATSIALAIHFYVSQKEPPAETCSYTLFLCGVLVQAS